MTDSVRFTVDELADMVAMIAYVQKKKNLQWDSPAIMSLAYKCVDAVDRECKVGLAVKGINA